MPPTGAPVLSLTVETVNHKKKIVTLTSDQVRLSGYLHRIVEDSVTAVKSVTVKLSITLPAIEYVLDWMTTARISGTYGVDNDVVLPPSSIYWDVLGMTTFLDMTQLGSILVRSPPANDDDDPKTKQVQENYKNNDTKASGH